MLVDPNIRVFLILVKTSTLVSKYNMFGSKEVLMLITDFIPTPGVCFPSPWIISKSFTIFRFSLTEKTIPPSHNNHLP